MGSRSFIHEAIDEDLRTGRYERVHTRFPPEPNGYLHIGHAKSIYINFTIADEYGGKCNLRFDDTNPEKEDEEYIRAIKEDVRWLGFDWEDREYYASDYFDRLYECAVRLIKEGKAYVDHLSQEEIRRYRGTLTEPGKESPYRDRSVEENLRLFEDMKNGKFREGECVLRAKIDMSSPNIVMRDPTIYRIKKVRHPRTGDKWCIYPMYDFAHCISDSIEGITHSLCTLEFENNRPLYDWFLEQLGLYRPRQIEFARLNVSHTVLSKRKLKMLVEGGYVDGWDDPRMPTIAGMRRRGYTPEAIREFCRRVGIAKKENLVELALLEHCVRDDLNKRAQRRLCVLDPIKLVIVDYPSDRVEYVEAVNNPEDPSAGTRRLPFTRELYIEREDFMENPPPKFFRLAPGKEVRLRHAYVVKCVDVRKDADGNVVEVLCEHDPLTLGKGTPDGRKVKGTIHWVSARHAVPVEVRLYDTLFSVAEPESAGDAFLEYVNPDSLRVLHGCMGEESLRNVVEGERFQFERVGYFCVDRDSRPGRPVFNRTVSLKDRWSRHKFR